MDIYPSNEGKFARDAEAIEKIDSLKKLLQDTDYKVIKQFEMPYYTDAEFKQITDDRRAWRDAINAYEIILKEE